MLIDFNETKEITIPGMNKGGFIMNQDPFKEYFIQKEPDKKIKG